MQPVGTGLEQSPSTAHLICWESRMERFLCQYSSNKSSVLQINTICFAKKISTFKQTQSDLQIQNCIWEKMQRYGQIYVLCVTTVRLICLFMRKLGLIFSQMRVGRFSHKCVLADFLTNACRLIFSHVQLSNFLFQKQQMALSIYASLPRPKTPLYLFRPIWVGNRWVSVLLWD